MLANEDPTLRERLEAFRAAQTLAARDMVVPPAAATAGETRGSIA